MIDEILLSFSSTSSQPLPSRCRPEAGAQRLGFSEAFALIISFQNTGLGEKALVILVLSEAPNTNRLNRLLFIRLYHDFKIDLRAFAFFIGDRDSQTPLKENNIPIKWKLYF